MKLNFKELKIVAKENKCTNGENLLKKLGYMETYQHLLDNNMVGYEFVKDLYNALGEDNVSRIIDFEGGSIDDFKSKYIQIGNNLI